MKIANLSLACLALGGCSVGMAARTGGVKTEDVTMCESRACFVSQDTVEVIERREAKDGGYSETYKFQLKRGSAGRAAMHGLLDVATLGAWEVAGTPIEATKNRKYIVITADYDKDGRLLRKSLGTVGGGDAAPIDDSALPEGIPVRDDGKLIGVVTPDGEFIKVEDIVAPQQD